MGYEWSPINSATPNDPNNPTYGVQEVFHFPGNVSTWGMVWYDDAPKAPASAPEYYDPGPSQYSYQAQVPYEYYQDVEVTQSIPGVIIAQTFVAPRSGWLTDLGLFYTKVAADGNVRVMVCRTVNGKPDLSRVLSEMNLLRADMKRYTSDNPLETKVAMPPIMVKAGERYAIVEVTLGAHYAAMAEAGYTEGTFFTGTDGQFFQGDITKDRKFKVYMARFLSPRTEVNLQTVSLAGGIADLSIRTEQPLLEGAELIYEVQLNGKWERLTGDNLGALSALPNLLPLRAVFTGTADIQVGLQLGENRVVASRPAVASNITSKAISCPARRYFQVDFVVPRWEPTKNTHTVQLLSGAGYATVTNSATAVVLDEAPRPGWKRLRYTFDVGANITSYKVKSVMTRAADGKSVKRMERTSVATG